MADWLIGIIMGAVEGLTEFLPVSSTGHMILTGHLLGFDDERAKVFEVVIQLGSILAVVVIFWKRSMVFSRYRKSNRWTIVKFITYYYRNDSCRHIRCIIP